MNQRLDYLLLQNTDVQVRSRSDMKSFCEVNLSSEVAFITLWDAFKAFIRGMLLSQTAHIKKRRKEVRK